MFKLSQFHFKV